MATQPHPNLALELIRRDGGTQPRDQISADVVDGYAEAIADGATFPPVTAFYDGSDYWLADGFHRVAAHEQLGLAEIAVDVRQGVRRDAILYSVSANATHGHRRSNADKRRAVLTLLNDAEWAGWSDREIARRAAVSHNFASSLRPASSLSSNDSERTYTTKHGTVATMNTAAIGKPNHTAETNMNTTALVDSRAKAVVPEGGDLIELCRKGIALEQSGHSAETAGPEVGLGKAAYRVSRQIVFLAEQIELAPADAAAIADAFNILADTQNYNRAWEIAEPIAIKVWGEATRRDGLATLADRRIERFERTFGIVMQSCLASDEIELPYLTAAKANQFTKEINRARKALAAFAARIEGTHA